VFQLTGYLTNNSPLVQIWQPLLPEQPRRVLGETVHREKRRISAGELPPGTGSLHPVAVKRLGRPAAMPGVIVPDCSRSSIRVLPNLERE